MISERLGSDPSWELGISIQHNIIDPILLTQTLQLTDYLYTHDQGPLDLESSTHGNHDWGSVSGLRGLRLTNHAIQLDGDPSALEVNVALELEPKLGVEGIVGWVRGFKVDGAVLSISL